ncbi:SAM-dependent methyltransferase [Spirillospora sp. NPDC047279]|uniref:SAM-dependent methyltransferase n=1 Tax=Spirillospora sp. NPDC047279 TaxID=3155478 RepID=UPI0033C8927F
MSSRPDPDESAFSYDPSRPSIARVYDYWLGGKDNFGPDRQFAVDLAEVLPDVTTIVRANREFLGSVVTRLVKEHEVGQFLDIGAGLPTADNVHQVAQSCDPSTRVVYVDNDTEVIVHARALLAANDRTGVVHADLRDPAAVLDDPVTVRLLDLTRPAAVMLVSILHFIGDDEDAHGLVTAYMDAMPSGSFLVISSSIENPAGRTIENLYRDKLADRGGGGTITRTREEILRFFDGLEILEPGLVTVTKWDGDGPEVPFVAAVGRKP